MILIILASIYAVEQPSAASTEQVQMNPQIARQRVSQIIQDENGSADPQKTLVEIIERCNDLQVVSLAHYTLGTTLLNRPEQNPQTIQSAIESFEMADLRSDDLVIRSQSRFNIGHAYYELAHLPKDETQTDQNADIQSVIETLQARVVILRTAAGAFRSVMDVSPTNHHASKNVERVRMEVRSLEEQIQSLEDLLEQQKQQQQEQQQQQQQEQQDAADKLSELAQQQQQQADQSSSNPPTDETEQENQQQSQAQLSEETESTRKEISQQESSKEQLEQIEKKIQEAQESQKKAQEAMEEGDQERAGKEQQKAADALKEAAQSMQELADQSKAQSEGDGKDESNDSQPSAEQQSPEQEVDGSNESDESSQADQISEIARQLLDKERREREARQAYRAVGRPTKVEKDW